MPADEPKDESQRAQWFPVTHWTDIVAARREGSSTAAEALDRLCGTYWYPIYAYIRRKGHSDADAADFTQDVFVVLVQNLPQFQYDSSRSFRSWLKTVLTNTWRLHHRQASRLPTTTGDPNLAPDSDPAEILDNAEHRQYLVRRALAIVRVDFEEKTWKACWEFVVNERSAAEVSVELGISENAVYLAKSRILRHLRIELAGLLDD